MNAKLTTRNLTNTRRHNRKPKVTKKAALFWRHWEVRDDTHFKGLMINERTGKGRVYLYTED